MNLQIKLRINIKIFIIVRSVSMTNEKCFLVNIFKYILIPHLSYLSAKVIETVNRIEN